jgi:hypothetical protein
MLTIGVPPLFACFCGEYILTKWRLFLYLYLLHPLGAIDKDVMLEFIGIVSHFWIYVNNSGLTLVS